jgi:outer membrane protein assembly factor BamB
MHVFFRSRAALASLITLIALGASGCADDAERAASDTSEPEPTGTRLAVTHDAGVLVLERDSLEPVADLETSGFVRVNPAGDDRHVFVSTEEGFRLLDTGVTVESHGDHSHFHADGDPSLGETMAAPEPGHVTVHDGTTALFSDGTGKVQLLDADDPTTVVDTYEAPDAHHGVAVAVEGGLLVTEGTADERRSAVLLDDQGKEVARADSCPGVHGEATAADGVVVLGCEDGVLVHRDGEFTKVDSPDAYGRIGNQAGSAASQVVLGDYKVDEDAELERPERISLIDTESMTMRLVDLGTSYSFRSLGRGPAGEALVLGTDGALHVLDEGSGETLATIPVVDAWTEPTDWTRPRPALHVDGDTAWVTDPAMSSVHAVDLVTSEVTRTGTLEVVPNEITAG